MNFLPVDEIGPELQMKSQLWQFRVEVIAMTGQPAEIMVTDIKLCAGLQYAGQGFQQFHDQVSPEFRQDLTENHKVEEIPRQFVEPPGGQMIDTRGLRNLEAIRIIDIIMNRQVTGAREIFGLADITVLDQMFS